MEDNESSPIRNKKNLENQTNLIQKQYKDKKNLGTFLNTNEIE